MIQADALISADGMKLAYGTTVVFERLSLAIRSGELLSIVGPSGCGKTSLLLALAGLLQPNAGKRILDTRLPNSEIVYIPQQDALLPWRTLRANIRLGLELRENGRASTSSVDEWAKTFNASDFLLKRAHELSGGMRKRICLARSFCARPSVVLLDEPFNNLDVTDHRRVESFLCAWVREDSHAIVCVTHDIEQAAAIGDRIGYFTNRRQLQRDDAAQFDVVPVPESLQKYSPVERRLHPEFFAFVSKIERTFDDE
jgi:NitT/TauT family transport system ATP-binding protein